MDEESEKPMLIGYCTREAFNDTSFSEWWNEEYNMYEVDVEIAEQLKDNWDNVEITLVIGTWCSDSRREVPRFYRILDKIEYPSEIVNLISVNRDKVGLANEVDGLEIHFVPTIIFYGNGKELGRIVEMPYESLEKDMLEMVKK
jgi:thiol-disulfide isomerase/thioredoxin